MIYLYTFLIVSFTCWLQILTLKPRKNLVFPILLINTYHFSFAIIFHLITKNEITDSFNYFNWAHDGLLNYNDIIGSNFIIMVVSFLLYLGIESYIIILMIFTSISSFAIIVFYLCANKILINKGLTRYKNIIFLALLMPGLHYWTVPIGKDGLILLGISLILNGYINRTNFFVITLGLIICFMVRPHIGLVLFFCYLFFIYNFLKINLPSSKLLIIRFLLILALPFLVVLIYNFVLGYLQKYSAGGFFDLNDFVSSREDIYSNQGSGFDNSSIPFVFRFLLFFLGGIPWGAKGAFQFLAIVEGLFYLFFLYRSIIYLFFVRKYHEVKSLRIFLYEHYFTIGCFIFIILLASMLALTSGNFGLIVRQRVMVYMPLLILYIYSLSNFNRHK